MPAEIEQKAIRQLTYICGVYAYDYGDAHFDGA